MPTGMTGVPGGAAAAFPASASAMAGASSVNGGIPGPGSTVMHVTRMPTGASSAMRGFGMGPGPESTIPPHPTGMTFMSAATIPSLPGGFKTSVSPHNAGAAGAFNFQNLPPPVKESPQAEDDGAASFVGAPTRGLDVETSSNHPAAAKSPSGGAGAPLAGMSSAKPPGSPMSKTMKYATELPSKELEAAIPKSKTLSDATIAESRGAALVDATRAFYGTHRPAYAFGLIWVPRTYSLSACCLIALAPVQNGLFGVYRPSTTRGCPP